MPKEKAAKTPNQIEQWMMDSLLSLMKDQVNALVSAGISAACINSSLTKEE